MGDIVNAVADVFGFGPASKQADAMSDACCFSSSASIFFAVSSSAASLEYGIILSFNTWHKIMSLSVTQISR